MRPSPCRHPLAVLRLFLKLSQKEMANLIGCSASAVQAIELKQLKLTEELAQRVVKVTGVNFRWLIEGNPKARMLNTLGRIYCRYNYELAQGMLKRELYPEVRKKLRENTHAFADYYRARLYNILYTAIRTGRYPWALWKLDTLLEELENEFGIPDILPPLEDVTPDVLPHRTPTKKR
jgi:transcriptional regulator with XRE-family HTH domain